MYVCNPHGMVQGRELQLSSASFTHFMVKAGKGQSSPNPCQLEQLLEQI